MTVFFIHNGLKATQAERQTKSFKNFMEKEDKAVEAKTEAAAPQQEVQIDYKAELDKQKGITENYRLAALKAKGKLPQDTIDLDEDKMEDLATRVANKISPDLKSSLVSTVAKNDLDSKLDKLTANADEKELIRYHFEYSTAGEDVDSRLQNAYAIANKDRIARKASEMELAKNRQTSSTSMGSSTESGLPKPNDDTFTPEQLKWIEQRAQATGIKIDLKALKENMRLVGGMPGMFMTGAHTIHKGVNYN